MAAGLRWARGRLDVRDVFFLMPQGVLDRDQNLRSLELLAEKVMPRFAD